MPRTSIVPTSQPALPEALTKAAKGYQAHARAPATRRAYKRAWQQFAAWCEGHGCTALPASPETIAHWMTALADGEDGSKALARASINQAISAVTLAHHTAGHPFDRKHPLIAETWRGISRVKAKNDVDRQALPLMGADLKALLDAMQSPLNADLRDRALLAVGWAGALRRSELVGLDWQHIGTGTGFVRLDERGIAITLATSKASQVKAETVAIPRADMPAACDALEAWVKAAGLKLGEPVFRPVDQRQIIGASRLTDRSVARIIKARVRELVELRGKGKAEAAELVRLISGHSLRAGYATSAAANDMPGYRLQRHTRHKSAEMVSRYIREAEAWTKSGLKGIGF